MEVTNYKLVWAGQILTLWIPIVLTGCDQELNILDMGEMQKLVPLQQDMHMSCQALIDSQSDECSADCDEQVQKMVELFHESAVFFTCDCSAPAAIYPEDICVKVQDRLVVCPTLRAIPLGEVTQPSRTTPTILVDGMIPCDKARRRCVTDGNCRSQLDATISACGGPGCDEGCQTSLDTLLAQRKAQGMWGCSGCGEGPDDSWCDISRRCTDAQDQGTVQLYKLAGTTKSTTYNKTNGGNTDAQDQETVKPYKLAGTTKSTPYNKTNGGSTRKSVKPSPRNAAGPTCAVCISSAKLYVISSIILCIAFV